MPESKDPYALNATRSAERHFNLQFHVILSAAKDLCFLLSVNKYMNSTPTP